MTERIRLRIGRYTLFDEIAAGGMASVHIGRMHGAVGFSKTVAIKRLHPQFAKDDEVRAMFLDEARLASRVQHTNVVQVLDAVQLGQEVFLVMEYVHGESLSSLLLMARQKRELVPTPLAGAIATGILHGLHAAHEARGDDGRPLNIVHRDVSPQNVLVGVDGVARVIDFGIAMAEKRMQSTREGQLKGKLAYMSPEQLAEEPVSSTADVYAAGIVLWEMLVGRKLFDASEPAANYVRIMKGDIPRPRDVNPNVEPELEEVAMRAVQFEARDRFPTAREMALAIESATPLAPPTAVANWVQHLASQRLDARLSLVATVEKASTDSDLSIELVTDESEAIQNARSGQHGAISRRPPPPSSRRPPPEPPPASSRRRPPPPSMRDTSASAIMRDTPPASIRMPVPQAPPTPPPTSQRPPDPNDTIPPVSRASGTFAPPPGSLRKPEIMLPEVAWLPPPELPFRAKEEPKSGSGMGWLVFAIVVVLGLGAFWFALPFILVDNYVKSARAAGFDLEIGRAQVSLKEVRLLNVTVTSPEVPGFKLRASNATVVLSGLSAQGVDLGDVDVQLEGTPASVQQAFNQLAVAHPAPAGKEGGLGAVRINSGHVSWTAPFGTGTSLEGSAIEGDVTAKGGRTLGDDLHVVTGVVRITAGASRETWGPWKLDLGRDAATWKAKLSLDPTDTVPSTLTLTVSPDGGRNVDAKVAGPLKMLGVPPRAFGSLANERTILHLETTYRSDPKVAQGQAFLGLSPIADTAVDLGLQGRVEERDPKGPTRTFDGDVAVGTVSHALTGTFTLGDDYLACDARGRYGDKLDSVLHLVIDTRTPETSGIRFETQKTKLK